MCKTFVPTLERTQPSLGRAIGELSLMTYLMCIARINDPLLSSPHRI